MQTFDPGTPGPGALLTETLDLATGALTTGAGSAAVSMPPGAASYLGQAGSTPMWVSPGGTPTLLLGDAKGVVDTGVSIAAALPIVSPDARYVLAGRTVVDAASGSVVATLGRQTANGYCSPLGWWTATSLLLECADQDPITATTRGTWQLVTIGVDRVASGTGAVLHDLAAQEPMLNPYSAAWLADRRVVVGGAVPGSQAGLFVVGADGVPKALDLVDPRADLSSVRSAAAGGVLVVGTDVMSPDRWSSFQLTAYDADGGSPRVLLAPPATSDSSGTDSGLPRGVTSWVLAH